MKTYTFKRRETKYYKEVVVEGVSYACYRYEFELNNWDSYVYTLLPLGSSMVAYVHKDGFIVLPTSINDLVEYVGVDWESLTEESGVVNGLPHSRYPEGDLTSTTTELVESTKDDYDIVKNEDSFYSLRRPDTTFVKSWTQPILTSNGTLGSGGFAIQSDSVYNSTYDAFKCLDGDMSTCWMSKVNLSSTTPVNVNIDFGKNINIKNLKFTNRTLSDSSYIAPVGNFNVWVGENINGDYNWVLLGEYTNTENTSGASWNVDLSYNENFYRYCRLEFTKPNSVNNSDLKICISDINITAFEKITHHNIHSLYRR